jgi:preprotein translocase subunit YajC
MIYRRQRSQYFFGGLLAVLAIVNVLFYFILNRPTRLEYEGLQKSVKQLRLQTGGNKGVIVSLQKTSTQIAHFDQDKRNLLMKHLVQRTPGYSHIVSTLESLVQRTGVKKTRVNYVQDPVAHAGLNSVSLTLPLEGNYSNVVSFIRELENSDTFFLINAIDLESSSGAQPGNAGGQAVSNNPDGSGSVALSLALETYFYQ